jgi:UDP-N-acetylmuramoyl-L-alanyl-D-glutamate--2,6-diaminopimelate ligase
MRLDELIAGSASSGAQIGAGGDVEIGGLAYDSRTVRGGELFFCVSGFERDGHEFAPQAVAAGAAALVVERPLGLGVPEVRVASARAAMAPIAARFYGDPTAQLRVVGVTGTNGKTTTAYLVRALLEAAGEQCGLLGTVTSIVGGEQREVVRTTPEAIDLQRTFREMLDGGDRACAIEVSSHALALGRADAVRFAAAVFTNLTQDHLDFHETMEDYFRAKRRLFVERAPGVSVVNVGDAYGRRLARELAGARTFAVEAPADFSASDLRCDLGGCAFMLRTPRVARELRLAMPGAFNVANALAALAVADALLGGERTETLLGALERGARVPGRFEPVEEGQEFAVLVDYAHTPDSLENVLAAARGLIGSNGQARGRVLCVFGAGGDRDRGKRPLMGEIATRLADVVLVTSDNPRSEEPEQIIAEIMAGVARVQAREQPGRSGPLGAGAPGSAPPPVRSIADRARAIDEAIAAAQPGDVVVIAGKGHEQGQELAGGRKVPFDDVAVARQALRARGARR